MRKRLERAGKRQTENYSVWRCLLLQLCSYDLGHEIAHFFGSVILHLSGGVSVGAEGKPSIVVPQHSGYRFHIHAVLECQCRESVAKVVEADVGQPCVLENSFVEVYH